MAEMTYYVALPFVATDDGIAPGNPVECPSAQTAIARAELLSRTQGHVGAVAFKRSGDPKSGEFADAEILKSFGDVPDLSAL